MPRRALEEAEEKLRLAFGLYKYIFAKHSCFYQIK